MLPSTNRSTNDQERNKHCALVKAVGSRNNDHHNSRFAHHSSNRFDNDSNRKNLSCENDKEKSLIRWFAIWIRMADSAPRTSLYWSRNDDKMDCAHSISHAERSHQTFYESRWHHSLLSAREISATFDIVICVSNGLIWLLRLRLIHLLIANTSVSNLHNRVMIN